MSTQCLCLLKVNFLSFGVCILCIYQAMAKSATKKSYIYCSQVFTNLRAADAHSVPHVQECIFWKTRMAKRMKRMQG